MELYSENDAYKLYHGNMLDMLEVLEKESIDSIVCDPPYGLTSITKRFGKEDSAECQYGNDGSFQRLSKGFMGKEWDGSGIEYNVDAWKKCYEVLKPGGYLLAFGGSRTFHRIACAIEDAGFEIRDTIMWLYGSGFPKSMNIGLAIDKKNGVESEVIGTSKSGKEETHTNSLNMVNGGFGGEYEIKKATNEWNGWGTALKPSFEPVIVARKPCEGSCVDNVLKYGVGGINIDECRVEYGNETDSRIGTDAVANTKCGFWSKDKNNGKTQMYKDDGRYPANTILTYCDDDFEEVCGGFPNTKSTKGVGVQRKERSSDTVVSNTNSGLQNKEYDADKVEGFNDSGNASRYFYCAKASKKDRDEGLCDFIEEKVTDGCIRSNEETARKFGANSSFRKNTHPTVKPTELMQYLVRLVTPVGGGSSRPV